MGQLSNGAPFVVFAAVMVLETLKTLFLGTATAVARARVLKFVNQEDAAWLGGEAVEIDHPDAARLLRAHRNNLENLLPFFVVGSLYLISGASAFAGVIYSAAFLVGRFLHTYAYLSGRAMMRRNAYASAWLVTVVMTIHASGVIIGRAL